MEKFERIINCPDNPTFQRDLKESEYGYYYNVSGIEIAYAAETFLHDQKKAREWIERQFRETWFDQFRPLVRGASDKNTAIARIYQAARLVNDYEIEISK